MPQPNRTSVGRQGQLRYFDRQELARRYESSRPRVHGQVIDALAHEREISEVGAALDVACGTGHSTAALSAISRSTFGCELSRTMLGCSAPSSPPLVQCAAEALPFRSHAFALLTVSMAFHWFDQRRFLAEAGRVLATHGELWVYNLFFPGVLVGDPSFSTWHRESYLPRFPSPARHSDTLEALLSDLPLRFGGDRWLSFEVPFSARGLRNYLTTQSNVEAALRSGASIAEVDEWLDSELGRFFQGEQERQFRYGCRAQIAVAVQRGAAAEGQQRLPRSFP